MAGNSEPDKEPEKAPGNKLGNEPGKKWSVTSFSHIGNREENQDRCGVWEDESGQHMLCLVADGMGGHKGGALAAAAIIDTAKALWQAHQSGLPGNQEMAEAFLYELVAQSHITVNKVGAANNLEPRSTLAALYLFEQNGSVGAVSIHAGDSRITQYSTQERVAQSVDHSLAQLKVLQGKITEEQLADDPDQGTVISNIGGEDPPDPEITHWDTTQGGLFTISSDGFWEIASSALVLEIFAREFHLRERQIQSLLQDRLVERPRHDNTTVIMIEIHDSRQESVMTDDKQESANPEVEDPITNPGKKTPVSDTDEVHVPTPVELVAARGKNRVWVLLAGVVILAAGLGLIFSGGGSDQANTQNPAPVQNQGDPLADNTQPPANGEGVGGEGGEGEGAAPVAQEDTQAPSNAEGGAPEDRVLDSVDLNTDITATSDEELIDEVTDMLVLNGRLGPDDVLEISSDSVVGDNRVIRLQQNHQGIPVFGAVVVAVENNEGAVFNLSGSTGSDIDVEVEPALTYAEALDIATGTLEEAVSPPLRAVSEELAILEVDGVYHLAWTTVLNIGGNDERVFLDARDGAILLRLPLMIGED